MGVHSTIDITREAATALVLKFIRDCSDYDLERIADVCLDDSFYNCKIVGKDQLNEDWIS